AARHARRIVVVGPEPAEPIPAGVLRAREQPPFGGPAAGIAAGLHRLSEHAAGHAAELDAVLVLACDMPHIDRAVPVLLAALTADTPLTDGVIVVAPDGQRQPLAALYRSAALAAAIVTHASELDGLSVRRLVGDLELTPVTVPEGAT